MRYTYDIYLSGPMSGMPDNNHSDFLRAASNLRACGYCVFEGGSTQDWTKIAQVFEQRVVAGAMSDWVI